MTLPLIPFTLRTYRGTFYALKIDSYDRKCAIRMNVRGPVISTRSLPQTKAILAKKLPRIFGSKCYNDHNWSFRREVQETEIGHLFEHILLENLTKQRLYQSRVLKIYKGATSWDWSRFGKGVFDIVIDCGVEDWDIISNSLKDSILLTDEIMASNSYEQKDDSLGYSARNV